MSERLSASELAELVGCKPNQRSLMIRWLHDRHWKYDIDRTGLPIVYRAYRDRKLGLSDEKQSPRYADAPNRQAFSR
jgi:hypothetical protein